VNHKRRRQPNARAGCKMCKPQKSNKFNDETSVYHVGFGKIRKLAATKQDMSLEAVS